MPPQEISRSKRSAFFHSSCPIVVLALLSLLLPALPAYAASQAEVDGARVTLRALEDGAKLRGVLEIELKPGWKTYWVSPGPVGLAPQIDLSASEDVSQPHVAYPAPTRFKEGDVESIGYTEPMGFAIEADRVPGMQPVLRAGIVLGLCRELCLPVQLQLEAEPSTSLDTRAAARRAFDALPARAASADGWKATLSGDAKHLTVHAPSKTSERITDVFVAAPEGWAFGQPSAAQGGVWTLPVLAAPSSGQVPERVDLVLTDGEKGKLIPALPVGRD